MRQHRGLEPAGSDGERRAHALLARLFQVPVAPELVDYDFERFREARRVLIRLFANLLSGSHTRVGVLCVEKADQYVNKGPDKVSVRSPVRVSHASRILPILSVLNARGLVELTGRRVLLGGFLDELKLRIRYGAVVHVGRGVDAGNRGFALG